MKTKLRKKTDGWWVEGAGKTYGPYDQDEAREMSEALETGDYDDELAEYDRGPEYGGAFDGVTVSSDADPGL